MRAAAPGPLSAVALLAVLTAGGCRDEEPAAAPGRKPPSSPLAEREVRNYIEVAPGVFRIYESVLDPAGPPNAAQRKEIPKKLDAYLAKHHHTRATWNRLSRRVGYVVNAIRFEEERPRRNKELQQEIGKQKQLAEDATDDLLREQTATRIAQLEAQRDAPAPPTHEADRALVKSFWTDLDRLVPRRRPTRPQAPDSPPNRPTGGDEKASDEDD